jgi:thioredoxin-related protein
MKQTFTLISICFSAFSLLAQHGGQATTTTESTNAKIHWLTFEEAFAMHQVTPKKWVIDVSTDWCGWCKRMDKTTFSDSLVIDHVNANFYAVALDGEYKEPIVVGDRTYEFVAQGQRGYHELPAELMGGKMSYPTIVFLGEGLQNLSSIPGYKDAASFLQIVEFFEVYDAVKNPIKWEEFVQNYVSPYPKVEETTTN